MRFSNGVLLGRIDGTEIRMGLLFPVTVLLLCQYGEGQMAGLCLLASCMHECGHLTALCAVGCHPRAVMFGGFGIRISLPFCLSISYLRQAVVSLAGPVESGVAAAIGYALGLPNAAGIHLILCLFNLLPIDALDGGQALRFFLCQWSTPDKAERVVRAASWITVILLTGVGVAVACFGRNVSLLLVCGYLIFCLLLKNND